MVWNRYFRELSLLTELDDAQCQAFFHYNYIIPIKQTKAGFVIDFAIIDACIRHIKIEIAVFVEKHAFCYEYDPFK